MIWNRKIKKSADKKTVRLFGWHGNDATGDDLLGHCVKSVFHESANKLGLELDFVENGKCDLAVIGGGTILGIDSTRLYKQLKGIKAPLVIYGGGFRREKRDIGDKNRSHMRYLFKRAHFAGVRGYISKQFLIQNDIADPEVIGDPGMLFKPEPVTRLFDGQYKVGVFLRNMGKAGELQYVDNEVIHKQIADVCDWIAESKNANFYFYSFAENRFDSDMEGINKVLSHMKNKKSVEVIPYSSDYVQKCSMIGSMDYIVSQRLHPVILSWLMKIPCIGFDYQFSKTTDFMNSIGMDEFVFRTDEFSIDVFKIKFDRLSYDKHLIIEHSQKSIKHWQIKLKEFADKSLGLIA